MYMQAGTQQDSEQTAELDDTQTDAWRVTMRVLATVCLCVSIDDLVIARVLLTCKLLVIIITLQSNVNCEV